MLMANVQKIADRSYKGQRYVFGGCRNTIRRDGALTEIELWKGWCAECGAPFWFYTPIGDTWPTTPNRRCHKHHNPGVLA